MVLKSFAKLNLYLAVLNKRKDGFHNLNTLFERIDLRDKITLKARRDSQIKIICINPDVPKDTTNLCWRSAKLLQEKLRVKKGVNITIIKRIPVGAGLGGGSSNAATTLLGLNRLWRLGVSREKLARFAQAIGSDVPFFVYNSPFAQGISRGEKIKPLKKLSKVRLWQVLVVPGIKVSTPQIYREFDALRSEFSRLTRVGSNVKLLTLALYKKDLTLLSGFLFNSLEAVTKRLYPEVARVKNKLLALGFKTILMSGSGPAVFVVVSSGKEAARLSRKLRREERSWQVFVTRTI